MHDLQTIYLDTKTAQVVAKLFPMFGSGSPLKVWAENGLVKTEDTATGAYKALLWVDAAERTIALSEMVINSHEQGYYSDETRRLQKFVTQMEDVIRRAKEQGSPPVDRRGFTMTKVVPVECELW